MIPTPNSIVQGLHRPSRYAGWIPTATGRGFHPLTPRTDEVRLADIARGTARKFRYGGQVEPVTVAEHCVLTSRIVETLWPDAGRARQLGGLLHDACEAYTHDIQATVRKHVRVELPSGEIVTWNDVDHRINQIVAKAFGIEPDFYGAPEVRAADILACALEKRDLPTLREGDWGLPTIPDEIANLTIECWSPEVAETAFLDRFAALLPDRYDELLAAR